MVYGIIGAMPVEIRRIRETMTVEREITLCDMTFYKGVCAGKEIVLVTCGVGKVNAAHTTMLLIDRFGVDCIINVGVAGGIHRDIHVKDVVIGTSSTTYDVGPSIMSRYYPFVSEYKYDERVIEAARQACESITDREWKYVVAKTITGDMFIDDSMLKEKLLSPYPDAYCIDMEAQAMAQICHIYKVPIANIRSISDNADDETTATYAENEAAAAEVAGQVLIETLKRL
ncbi:MAG: 5'-methylthioadenosine/adenosylhomocysteine nucleosidase [Clostridiales bacterium]|nr:5'-methylthioadenosine/adenosylhomocysteine nucleosidase [Clostridiales bacterium]